jgi:hypothetical protein
VKNSIKVIRAPLWGSAGLSPGWLTTMAELSCVTSIYIKKQLKLQSLLMPKITADIPTSLDVVLKDEMARTSADESSIVTAALARYLKTPVHTLFQVSKSGALVADAYSGAFAAAALACFRVSEAERALSSPRGREWRRPFGQGRSWRLRSGNNSFDRFLCR